MPLRHPTFLIVSALVLSLTTSADTVRAEQGDLAIGRLNYAGFSDLQHCTASLVAPRVAVTAFHCLVEDCVPEIHLLLGYDRGVWNEHLRPLYARRAVGSGDTALLCLDRPSAATPLELAGRPVEHGELVVVIGYGHPQVYVANRLTCRVTGIAGGGTFRLDCPLTPGTSGAPVLRENGGGHEIVGVISATSATSSLAYPIGTIDVAAPCDGTAQPDAATP